MLNTVNLMGRFTKDPELKTTPNGTMVISFTLAVDRDTDGADFISCVAWRSTAEFISKYFTKGQLCAVTGRIQTRDYTHQEQKRTATEVIVDRIYFAGKRKLLPRLKLQSCHFKETQ